MNKIIYLATTYKCSACKLEKYLLEEALESRKDIELKVCDYTELPQWLKSSVKLTDFPVTILIENNIVEYYFVGTITVKKFNKLLEDINF